jgi:hypothetical protein
MSNNFSLDQLTEGIRQRHLGAQNRRLIEKWSRTGLLRGLKATNRENMALMLENQAAQLLRERNSISTGGGGLGSNSTLRGFTNIAFPIVRRVFGGLVANELVSIQPMSLPSGLLFYLDYTYGTPQGGVQTDTEGTATYLSGSSIYNNPAGKSVQGGSDAVGGQYDLAGSGYSRVHKRSNALDKDDGAATHSVANAGAGSGTGAYVGGVLTAAASLSLTVAGTTVQADVDKAKTLLDYDPQIMKDIDAGGNWKVVFVSLISGDGTAANLTDMANADLTMVKDLALVQKTGAVATAVLSAITASDKIQGGKVYNVRRLNQLGTLAAGNTNEFVPDHTVTTATANSCIKMIVKCASTATIETSAEIEQTALSFVLAPSKNTDAPDTLVIPAFESDMATDPNPVIPEIDIKVESIAVTAATRKLRARWTPELAQDLNAYHSLDAEVELTQILSEQIALELDREILNDLLTQATGANLYWSRAPGKFVNKETGSEISSTTSLTPGPSFAGSVREWYETLTETIIDCANSIHRKTLRGSANFIVVSPDVATILESSVQYRPDYSLDGDGQVGAPFSLGADKSGTLSNRFTVYKDPYFPRNKVLVGYKGGSYLETGYVYAPYVPLIVTPTIFAPEDFTPRKGVMTRYGKKMVRADFYGTVTVQDLNII